MSAFSDSIAHPGSRHFSSGIVPATGQSVPMAILARLNDGCVLVAIFVVPMMSACLQELGNAIFITCSLFMALSWALTHLLTPNPGSPASGAELVAVGAIGLVLLQITPLPPAALSACSSFFDHYLTLPMEKNTVFPGSQPWHTLSVTPSLTRSGLVLLFAYVTFFLTMQQRLRNVENIEALIRYIAISAVIMALIGLGQRFAGNGLFLWTFEHPFRTTDHAVKGAFSNQNHFAHYLSLGIGPLIWCWFRSSTTENRRNRSVKSRRSKDRIPQSSQAIQNLALAGIAVVCLAVVLTNSRGGICSFLIAAGIAACVAGLNLRLVGKLLVPVALFAVLGVLAFGAGELQKKWATISTAESLSDLSTARFALWGALMSALPYFWKFGSGVGSHAEVYPTWMEQDFGVRFSHAESGYLQVLLETGVAGLLLLMAAIGLCTYWSVRCIRGRVSLHRRLAIVLSAGLVASVLHSTIDFVWYLPGCMVITLLLAVALCRCHQLVTPKSRAHSAPHWPKLFAGLVVVSLLPFGKLSATVAYRDAASEQDWNQYRKFAIHANERTPKDSGESLDERIDLIILHLENCLKADPADFRAASKLAAMYLRRFETNQLHADNQMNIREIRNTVLSAEFESPREIAVWLNRAFGPQSADLYRALSTARNAIRGQPLRGENYLVIAQVGFLAGLNEQQEERLLAQAIRLRPHDSSVQFVAGLHLAEHGDVAAAMTRWKIAFRRDKAIRVMIIDSLLPFVSAQEFVEKLEPGVDGLWLLFDEYRKRSESENQTVVAKWFADNFETMKSELAKNPNPNFWGISRVFFQHLGHNRAALECLRRACAATPQNFARRKELALALFEQGEFKLALRELQWCELKNPDDTEIRDALSHISRVSANEVNHERP